MLDAYFSHSRTSICCFDCLAFSVLPNGWTRMPKNSLYLSMLSSSQTLFMLQHKVWSIQIRTLCVRSTRSPRFVIDLNFQNLFVHFGMTESSISATPRSLSWSRFSISMQPIRTFRSHRVTVTACSSASRCHRVVPLGHTDRVRLYILPGQILEIFPKPFTHA